MSVTATNDSTPSMHNVAAVAYKSQTGKEENIKIKEEKVKEPGKVHLAAPNGCS